RPPLRHPRAHLSAAMVRAARATAQLHGLDGLRSDLAAFTDFAVSEPFDAALLLYGGLNYLLDEAGIEALLARVHAALRPGGLFVVDQSTPANSINNEAFFADEGEAEGFSFVRRSHYDREARLHTNEFELTVEGATYTERQI